MGSGANRKGTRIMTFKYSKEAIKLGKEVATQDKLADLIDAIGKLEGNILKNAKQKDIDYENPFYLQFAMSQLNHMFFLRIISSASEKDRNRVLDSMKATSDNFVKTMLGPIAIEVQKACKKLFLKEKE